MRSHRAWWPAFLIVPATFLADGSARAADSSGLPDGIHFRAGRYYEDVCDHSARFFCFSQRLLPVDFDPRTYVRRADAWHPFATPPANTMGPTAVLTAYSIPSSTSAGGKIVALVDLRDSSALSDVNTYRAAYGIPALAQCTGTGLPNPAGGTPCFATVDESGGSINQNVGDNANGDGETGLDMDMVSAACPDCSILLVQMNKAKGGGVSDTDLLNGAQTGVKLGAQAVSISFGGGEGGNDPTGFTTPGHLVLAAGGDQGYLLGSNTPSWPASAPDILGVGGTTLQNNGGTYSEIVWSDNSGGTGSGCSTEFPMPAFQTAFGASHFASCSANRASCDLSAAAEYTPIGVQGRRHRGLRQSRRLRRGRRHQRRNAARGRDLRAPRSHRRDLGEPRMGLHAHRRLQRRDVGQQRIVLGHHVQGRPGLGRPHRRRHAERDEAGWHGLGQRLGIEQRFELGVQLRIELRIEQRLVVGQRELQRQLGIRVGQRHRVELRQLRVQLGHQRQQLGIEQRQQLWVGRRRCWSRRRRR